MGIHETDISEARMDVPQGEVATAVLFLCVKGLPAVHIWIMDVIIFIFKVAMENGAASGGTLKLC
jgi:hypothetical protein